jgi:CheY-like chemotaxis protein
VYGIVRQSGGAVTLASTPGVGTQVTVYLPASGDDAPERTSRRTENGFTLSGPAASECVLLVEDEPQVRSQARRLLERCGFRVLEAGDGADGLRVFEAQRADIDAIVTDVVMPELGGVEMIGRVRALAPCVPVVFVSGFTAEDRDLPLDSRTLFVPKPYTIATLRGAIESVVAA